MGLKVKPGARPLVVLKIMGPVRFVFDVSDTYGDALTEAVRNAIEDPFHAQGEVNDLMWGRMLDLCASMNISFTEEVVHVNQAGYIRRFPSGSGYDLRINECHDRPAKFATLAHELGHLFCGHLGKSENDFWDNRLAIEARELEAEAVAYLVASRRKLYTASTKYLSLYLHPNATLPPISLEHILKAAGAIEEMAGGKLPAKERARRKKAGESKPRSRTMQNPK